MIDLNLMRTLLVLCEKRSLKQAGVKLGKTESAVSKQLSKLREQLGDVLFERTSSGLVPTEFTLSILPTIKQSIANIDGVILAENFSAKDYRKTISIAIPQPLFDSFGVKLYNAIKQSFVNANIRLLTWGDNTLHQILNNEIDVGLHYWTDERAVDIYQQVVCEDKMVVCVSRKYQNDSPWEEVKKWPFMRLHVPGWSDYRRLYVEHLKGAGLTFDYQRETDNVHFSIQLMQIEKIANVLPLSIIGEDLHRVESAQGVEMDVKLATSIGLINRSNPLHQLLHKIILKEFKK